MNVFCTTLPTRPVFERIEGDKANAEMPPLWQPPLWLRPAAAQGDGDGPGLGAPAAAAAAMASAHWSSGKKHRSRVSPPHLRIVVLPGTPGDGSGVRAGDIRGERASGEPRRAGEQAREGHKPGGASSHKLSCCSG
jgi:hypothetical protein